MIDRRKEVFLDGTVKREVVIDTGRLKKSMPQPEKHIDHETGKQYYMLRIGNHDVEDAEFEVID